MITTTDPGGLVMNVTLTKHENIQTVQQLSICKVIGLEIVCGHDRNTNGQRTS